MRKENENRTPINGWIDCILYYNCCLKITKIKKLHRFFGGFSFTPFFLTLYTEILHISKRVLFFKANYLFLFCLVFRRDFVLNKSAKSKTKIFFYNFLRFF